MSETEQRDLIERYLSCYNAFDVEGMLALLAPDVRLEHHSGDCITAQTQGIEEFRELAEAAVVHFDEREQRLVSLSSDGEGAIAGIAYRGRLGLDVPDGPTAGTVLELSGTSAFEFRDGRISRIVDRA